MRTLLIVLLILAACTPTPAPEPTAPPEVLLLATVPISPTPDATQIEATRRALPLATPTALASLTPSPTPFVGVFLGRAPDEPGRQVLNQPIFGSGEVTPTRDLRVCGIAIEISYEPAWRNNARVSDRLGCPIQAGFGFFGEVQIFERGAIYRQPETEALYAIVPAPTVGRFWYVENPPEVVPVGVPPAGRLAPDGDFGSMWQGVEGLRDELGWAITPPQEVAMGIQRMDGGTFLLDGSAGQVFALIVDGSAYGPFEAGSLPPTPDPGAAPAEPTDPGILPGG